MTLIQQMSISMVDLAVVEAEEKWLSFRIREGSKASDVLARGSH